ncbi:MULTISPECIES: class I adenylate-forming enzyme family protein [Noviherbaspirillum]|uniref:class I adenylate-forming enzyme family protein n=1 Tax=Noviherbaspirillum TaxID=1344552 RepID=UPI00124C6577|nr:MULTISPECIES: AMP-binding protein [Noviherbaspirillum]
MNAFDSAFDLAVGDIVRKHAVVQPHAIALESAERSLTYLGLNRRVNRLAQVLLSRGIRHGDRVAILSENCLPYLELELAAAKLGVIVPCLNWRLSDAELLHCIRLTEPSLILVSERYVMQLARIDHGVPGTVVIEREYETLLANATEGEPAIDVAGGDGLVILYTSGTTGLPKGALISHRAMIARAATFAADYGITRYDNYLAWSPLFHMAATDFSLATLMLGGKVIVQDGLQVDRMITVLEREPIGWLVAMPGMIENLISAIKRRDAQIRSVRMVGAMADLVPLQQIAELTTLMNAPYLNTFGSTETGLPPASAAMLPIGQIPASLSKRESGFCRIRLVDADGNDVPDGMPGELIIRGPTLFSGYWRADQTNSEDFRGGWFHMGDMFVRQPDGTLDFVDRVKYLIKSGGENIYPAEIERVLLAHPDVMDAVVVRQRHEKWGEVPVAFVAPRCPEVSSAALAQWCSERLASYKQPKEIRFVVETDFPRSSTGKIQRHEVERMWLTAKTWLASCEGT